MGTVRFTVKNRDVVGNILQEWVGEWLRKERVEFLTNPNTQMPPDFYLDANDKTRSLLEVKSFNYDANPGFDIADFTMYQNEVKTKPWVLDSDYLIFGYTMSDDGVVRIKKLWLKKFWEITSRMDNFPLKVQRKKNVIHKIRPSNFQSEKIQYKNFMSKEDFLSALEEAVYRNPSTHNLAGTWKNEFVENYKKHYGQAIAFERWNEVVEKYPARSK